MRCETYQRGVPGAKAAEQSNLPSQQEREDMRGYITAHRTRYLRRMANKRRR